MNTYKVEYSGFIFMAGAIAIFSGALGGTDFKRGVAGLLTIQAADVASLYIEGNTPLIRLFVYTILPVAIAVYTWGLFLMLRGLS